MPTELQTADYALCGLTIVMAVTGLFRGFSGTIAFVLASAAAAAAGSFGWSWSAEVTDATWMRGAGVLVAALLAFGIVRLIVKKLVNGLLAQPSDAILGAVVGAALGGVVVAVWARAGICLEYSALVRTVAEYVR